MKVAMGIVSVALVQTLQLVLLFGCGSPDTFRERLEKISKTSDQKKLAEIALHSDNSIFRRVAVIRLTDQDTLAIIAENDSILKVREAAVGRIESKNILADIATSNSHPEIRKLAAKRLDEVILAEVQKITDQNILINLAKNDLNPEVRIQATAKLTNQVVLAYLAQQDSITTIREIAAEKILDQSILAEIARNDEDLFVRSVATKKLTDVFVLAEIALYGPDPDIRYLATEKIEQIEDWNHNEVDESPYHLDLNRIRLILLEPNIHQKYGRLHLYYQDSISTMSYSQFFHQNFPQNTGTLNIIHVKIKIADDSNHIVSSQIFSGRSGRNIERFEKTIYKWQYDTPEIVPQSFEKTNFAQIDISKICVDLLQGFDSNKRQKIAKSENEYLKKAANLQLR